MTEPISILLIEDDLLDYQMFVRTIESIKPNIFRVAHASRFIDAKRLLKDEQFQIIVLDLHLPDGIGIPAIGHLNWLAPNSSLMVMTAKNDPGIADKVLAQGAGAFLLKEELSPLTLLKAIHRASTSSRQKAPCDGQAKRGAAQGNLGEPRFGDRFEDQRHHPATRSVQADGSCSTAEGCGGLNLHPQ